MNMDEPADGRKPQGGEIGAGKKNVSWRKKVLVSAAATVLSLAVAVAGVELYFRWKQRNWTAPAYSPELYTHDGKKLIPEQEGGLKLSLAPFTVFKNLPSQHTAAFNINSGGLRAGENAERDPSPKIVFLGGSAAFGFGARSDQETIPYLLEQSLRPYRVLNAGVVGFHSGQELTYLVTELIDFEPAVVVAYDGFNDLYDSIYTAHRKDRGDLGFNSNFFALEDLLLENYQTRVSLSRSLGHQVWPALLKSQAFRQMVLPRFRASYESRRTYNGDLFGPLVSVYADNLRKMARFSRASGARFIVVFQPGLGLKPHRTEAEQKRLDGVAAGFPGGPDAYRDLYRRFLAETKRLLARDGVEWLDVNESPEYLESTEELFLDVVHTNRRGNELAAAAIGRRLRALTGGAGVPGGPESR